MDDTSKRTDLVVRLDDAITETSKSLDRNLPALPRQTLLAMAEVFHASGIFKDIRSVAQAVVKIQVGRELGIAPFSSMNGIDIIEGRPILKPILLAAIVRGSNQYDYQIIELTHTRAVVRILRKIDGKWERCYPDVAWDENDMKRANLHTKDNWKKYTRSMLLWRAIADAAKWHCNVLFNGPVYIPDEMGLMTDEDGAAVDAEWSEVKKAVSKPERTDDQRRRFVALKDKATEGEMAQLQQAAFDWDVDNAEFEHILSQLEAKYG